MFISTDLPATFEDILNPTPMQLGDMIKKVREAKGLSSKEVALSCKMDPSQYSKIELGKGDPTYSTIVKISRALKVSVSDLFQAEDIFKDINSLDKSVIEKVSLVEQLDKQDKAVFFRMLDALVSNKRLKDSLHSAFGNK
jgi:transcriptional regulator with XRE-family HTH domain